MDHNTALLMLIAEMKIELHESKKEISRLTMELNDVPVED